MSDGVTEKLDKFLQGRWAGAKRVQGIQGGARAYALSQLAAKCRRPILALAVPRFAPAAVTISTRRVAADGGFRVITAGTLTRPTAVSAAQGCRGVVIVSVRSGQATLAAKAVRLNARCRFTSTVTVFPTTRRALNVVARFGGNPTLEPQSSRPRQHGPNDLL